MDISTPEQRKRFLKSALIAYGLVVQISIDVLVIAIVISLASSCSAPSHISSVKAESPAIELSLPQEATQHKFDEQTPEPSPSQHVFSDGSILMNAAKDENGEMTATDVINPAVVTARFRNVAERRGMVVLEFQIRVPESVIDNSWQLRFFPTMYMQQDTIALQPVYVTGEDYRRFQLRGYEQYERFLASIVTDTTRFVNRRLLEIFIERNIPDLYAFKTDSTFVSDRQFKSVYGVTEQEAVEHYTNKIARSRNRRRIADRQKMYDRYVKVPIDYETTRLDTMVRAGNGDFIYTYVQPVTTRPELKRIDVTLFGEIYQEATRIHEFPEGEPLTFYISSLSTLAESTTLLMPDGTHDEVYAAGLQAIRDRVFKTAVTLLRPYRDFNTALAYCAMEYNATALSILEELTETASVLYLKAIIYSRRDMLKEAMECYKEATKRNPSLVNRGNLDPEISTLKQDTISIPNI